jgi:pimeloyl-ACP methyl ester carboxylesterase
MATFLLAVLLTAAAPPSTVETLFVKVGPSPVDEGRSARQERVVVLVHGLVLHPISKEKASQAALRPWQEKGSALVKELSRHADVYALAYAQTAACEHIAEAPVLLKHFRDLKKAGYRDIVVVGHSAGGLIARQMVEDHADLGVTKVIQVCSPNIGTSLAALKTVRSVQAAFLKSLTHTAREHLLAARKDKSIPGRIQFACVVSSIGLGGDGIVSTRSQWSEDLQAQGIPAHGLRASHRDAVRGTRGVELIGQLVTQPQKRWDKSKVREARKKLFGG